MRTVKLSLIAFFLAAAQADQVHATSTDQSAAGGNPTVALTPEQAAAVDAAAKAIRIAPGALNPPLVRRDSEREELIRQLVACIGRGDPMKIEHGVAARLIVDAKNRNPSVSPKTWDAVKDQVDQDIQALYSTNLTPSLDLITTEKVGAARLSHEDIRHLISLCQSDPLFSAFESSENPIVQRAVATTMVGNVRVVSKIVDDGLRLNQVAIRAPVPSPVWDAPDTSLISTPTPSP